jgi:hypothetical protein
MCLYNFEIDKKSLFNDKDEITCYKVVVTNSNKKSTKYITPYYNSKVYLGKENKSDRKGIQVSPTEHSFNEINKGIHVFCDFCVAMEYSKYRFDRKIIEAICRKEDYVAHNNNDAVFTKVFYPRGQ